MKKMFLFSSEFFIRRHNGNKILSIVQRKSKRRKCIESSLLGAHNIILLYMLIIGTSSMLIPREGLAARNVTRTIEAEHI